MRWFRWSHNSNPATYTYCRTLYFNVHFSLFFNLHFRSQLATLFFNVHYSRYISAANLPHTRLALLNATKGPGGVNVSAAIAYDLGDVSPPNP